MKRKQALGYLKGAAMSYAYLFFSNRLCLGVVVLAITFFDVVAGVSGLIAIATSQLCSEAFRFNRAGILDGMYSYNALMVGLALGSYYEWSVLYLAVLLLASMLSLFLTVWISGRFYKRGLPVLSLPFLLTIWILLLGLFNFTGVQLAAKSAFTLQQWFPTLFEGVSNAIDGLRIANGLHIYLRSLSAIVFQYNDLAGIIIAVALLIRSRIAFALSIYGFLIGYGFYQFFEGDFTPLVYSYVGFNFILTAIAIGGFFIVPSRRSHLLLLFAIPVTALLLSALHTLFGKLGLPLYSLPFNIIVLLIIGALQMRLYPRGLEIVVYQQFSPEDNLYKHVYYQKRFAGQFYNHILLPVMGEWRVSQGYDGSITHRDEWQHALDFDITDEHGRTFGSSGFSLRDYYCYDLPVLAPAAGYVVCIRDGVPDNAVGDANLRENWGNTIIIKHAEGLYSKLSHLKPSSFSVKEGSYVQRGEIVASCGSSGRSPEPHLHFQAQATPAIGSKTLRYPLAYYLTKLNGNYSFRSFDIPQEGQIVRNVIPTPGLAAAFEFTPGEDISWIIEEQRATGQLEWSVLVDAANRKYIWCRKTDAVAYCYNDGVLAYFTDFYGDTKSFLYRFYIAFQKVLLGCYTGVVVHDALPPHAFFPKGLMAIQDFAAPFIHFTKGEYRFEAAAVRHENGGDGFQLTTQSYGILLNKRVGRWDAQMEIRAGRIEQVVIQSGTRKIIARCAS